jgi:hypothetical protein
MTSRDRVAAALRHEEPDRVPLDLGGVGGFMVEPLYFRLLDALSLDGSVRPYASYITGATVDVSGGMLMR